MFNTIVKYSVFSLLFFSFSLSYAEQCLRGRVNLLTEEGMKPARHGVPISIKGNSIEKEPIGSASTDKFGRFCISYKNIDAGLEVIFEIGDPGSENQQKWSSWVL